MSNNDWVSDYEDKRWYRILKNALKREGYDISGESLDPEDCLRIVQKLFNNPFSQVLETINEISGEGVDEE